MADEIKDAQTPQFVTLTKEQYDELLATQKTMADKLEALETAMKEQYGELLATQKTMADKLEALETAMNTAAPTDNALAISAPKKVELTGEKFKVGGKSYRAKCPSFYHNGRNISEAELLADSKLQKELVEGGYGVITEA